MNNEALYNYKRLENFKRISPSNPNLYNEFINSYKIDHLLSIGHKSHYGQLLIDKGVGFISDEVVKLLKSDKVPYLSNVKKDIEDEILAITGMTYFLSAGYSEVSEDERKEKIINSLKILIGKIEELITHNTTPSVSNNKEPISKPIQKSILKSEKVTNMTLSTITYFEFQHKKFRDSVLNKFEETQKEFETEGTISKTELGRKIEGMKIAFNELEDDNKDRKYVLENPLNEKNKNAYEIVDIPPRVTPFSKFGGYKKRFDVRIESEKNELELVIASEDKFLKDFERLIQALIVFESNLEGVTFKNKDYRDNTLVISCLTNGNLREKLLDSYDDTKRVFDYLFNRKNDEIYLSFTDELKEKLETHKITIEKNIKIIESLTNEIFVSESRKYLDYDNLLPKRFKEIFKYYKDGSIEFGSKPNEYIDNFYKRKNDEYYLKQPNESKPLKEKIIEDERVYLLRVGKLIERLTALVETRKKDIKNFKFKNFAFEKSDVRKVVEDTSDMLIKNLQLKIGEKVKSYTLNEIAEDLKNFDNSIDIIGRELTYKEIHGCYESVQAALSSWMTGKLSWNAPESAGIKSTKGFNFLYCTSLRVLYERLLNEGSTPKVSTPLVVASPQIETKPVDKEEVNHFCNGMPMSFVREHFKVLTTNLNRKKEPLLTLEQFEAFISRAFHNDSNVPKIEPNIGNREDKLIREVFYNFYASKRIKEYDRKPNRDNYIKLLTENIIGFELSVVKGNFNR